MNRIAGAFKKKAFIGFITAGDPDLDTTYNCILEMERAGASLVEIGIPFSDPVAEGPVIQEANIRALNGGVNTNKVFELVERVREVSDIPLCFMTYYNVVFHYGVEKFMAKCQEIGIDGLILPDLSFEESGEVTQFKEKYNLELISFVAPTSQNRVKMISKEAKGFIYLVSSMGVTGTRSSFAGGLEELVGLIKEETDTPVAIGFGINSPDQVSEFSQFTDGVIVGSAIVKIIAKHGTKAPEYVYEYVKQMVEALA